MNYLNIDLIEDLLEIIKQIRFSWDFSSIKSWIHLKNGLPPALKEAGVFRYIISNIQKTIIGSLVVNFTYIFAEIKFFKILENATFSNINGFLSFESVQYKISKSNI